MSEAFFNIVETSGGKYVGFKDGVHVASWDNEDDATIAKGRCMERLDGLKHLQLTNLTISYRPPVFELLNVSHFKRIVSSQGGQYVGFAAGRHKAVWADRQNKYLSLLVAYGRCLERLSYTDRLERQNASILFYTVPVTVEQAKTRAQLFISWIRKEIAAEPAVPICGNAECQELTLVPSGIKSIADTGICNLCNKRGGVCE